MRFSLKFHDRYLLIVNYGVGDIVSWGLKKKHRTQITEHRSQLLVDLKIPKHYNSKRMNIKNECGNIISNCFGTLGLLAIILIDSIAFAIILCTIFLLSLLAKHLFPGNDNIENIIVSLGHRLGTGVILFMYVINLGRKLWNHILTT